MILLSEYVKDYAELETLVASIILLPWSYFPNIA